MPDDHLARTRQPSRSLRRAGPSVGRTPATYGIRDRDRSSSSSGTLAGADFVIMHAPNRVSISWKSPPACSGGTVVGSDPSRDLLALAARRGRRCQLSLSACYQPLRVGSLVRARRRVGAGYLSRDPDLDGCPGPSLFFFFSVARHQSRMTTFPPLSGPDGTTRIPEKLPQRPAFGISAAPYLRLDGELVPPAFVRDVLRGLGTFPYPSTKWRHRGLLTSSARIVRSWRASRCRGRSDHPPL